MYSLSEWLHLDDQHIAGLVAQKAATAAIYLNGTRRWFLSQNKSWAEYAKTTGTAQRSLSCMFYGHGLQTLIQPLLGYDLLSRGHDYLKLAVEQGLMELVSEDYRSWFHELEIRVNLYGNWVAPLTEMGFAPVVEALQELISETNHYTRYSLLFGVFADAALDYIVSLAQTAHQGDDLLRQFYGQPIGPINLIVGSGQPVIWDLPLLDINKANLYFIQAPTFCLDKQSLRHILYDHLYQRSNDEELNGNGSSYEWREVEILGLGQRSQKGWIAT
jgi:hypothetical protein